MEHTESETTQTLVVERRVPNTHSATPAEHEWHRHPNTMPRKADNMDAWSVLTLARELRTGLPERDDEEYRVSLIVAKTETWVLA